MESRKIGSSDASSEENDRVDDQVKGDTAANLRRSYECTFCKRGFTNAQALGGHMNIHRRDRAKAKQPTSSVRFEPMNEDYMMNPSYLPPISTGPTNCYPVLEAHQRRNYHMYFQPPMSSSRLPSLSINEELLGANLSLQIGPNTHVDGHDSEVRREIRKEDEVDLELRLGHHP